MVVLVAGVAGVVAVGDSSGKVMVVQWQCGGGGGGSSGGGSDGGGCSHGNAVMWKWKRKLEVEAPKAALFHRSGSKSG